MASPTQQVMHDAWTANPHWEPGRDSLATTEPETDSARTSQTSLATQSTSEPTLVEVLSERQTPLVAPPLPTIPEDQCVKKLIGLLSIVGLGWNWYQERCLRKRIGGAIHPRFIKTLIQVKNDYKLASMGACALTSSMALTSVFLFQTAIVGYVATAFFGAMLFLPAIKRCQNQTLIEEITNDENLDNIVNRVK